MASTEQSGRDAEFVEFMAAAQPELLRMARFLTGSDDLARELTQDALVRAYAAWPRVRREGATAYTRRIMVNRRVNGWRRAARANSREVRPTQASIGRSLTAERPNGATRLSVCWPPSPNANGRSWCSATTSISANSRWPT